MLYIYVSCIYSIELKEIQQRVHSVKKSDHSEKVGGLYIDVFETVRIG